MGIERHQDQLISWYRYVHIFVPVGFIPWTSHPWQLKSRRGQFIWLYMVKQGALIHYQVLPDMMHSNAADNFSHASVRHADERTHILKAISGPLSESINHAGSIDNGWCSWCRSPFTAYWPDGSVNVTYICEDATVSSDTHQWMWHQNKHGGFLLLEWMFISLFRDFCVNH